jgi:hypothetical protein
MTIHGRLVLALLAAGWLGLAIIPTWSFYWSEEPLFSRTALMSIVVSLALALAACTVPDRAWRGPPWLGKLVIVAAAGVLAVQFGFRVWQRGAAVTVLEIFLCTAMLIYMVAVCRRAEQVQSLPAALLLALAMLLSGHAVPVVRLLYPNGPVAVTAIRWLAGAGFLTVCTFTLDLWGGCAPVCDRPLNEQWGPAARRRLFWPRVAVLFLTGVGLRAGTVVASPEPLIDVYVWLRDAPGVLLQGENPYVAEYDNVYASKQAEFWWGEPVAGPARSRLPAYPPLPMLLALPFRAAGLDVRCANVLCDLLAALVLLEAGRRRGSPLIGALAAGAYLHCPGAPLMTEQAWYEPMIAATLGGGLLLAERGRRLGYFLIGLGLAGKQYGIAMLPPVARAHWGRWPSLLVGILLSGAATALPFFLWDPHAFLHVVLFSHLDRPTKLNSWTLQTGAADMFGISLRPAAFWGLAAGLIGWVAWRTPRNGAGTALWAGTALLVFCLCHTQAFFNYFYLCQYLFLLGIVGLAVPKNEEISACGGAGIK